MSREPEKKLLGASEFQRLLDEARAGSNDALGHLLDENRNYLLWLANHELSPQVRTKGGASDIVQQTFLLAQGGFEGFRGHSHEQLQGWLRTILLNHLANFHRQYRETGKRQVAKETPLNTESSFQQRIVTLVDESPSPSSMLKRDEETQQLLGAIDGLREDYRQVIKLRYWERLTFSEIGVRMNRSPDAARKLWTRAFKQLEEQLERLQDGSR